MGIVPQFVWLETEEEVRSAFPVMRELRTHLDEETYTALVREAQEKEGYKLAALYDQDKMVAVVGFMPMITLYNGRFIWVCDLVTASSERSKGYGKALLSYVHEWAKEHGYGIVSLSSGLQRIDAHRFYEEKMEYEKVSYVFLKRLSS
ncbi:GNAT family N-acetyltransferase [Geobacillus zalihae]|uniref:GNAT family N-acetyltransferase n=1 Tax=Geobacillus zalihae TaxID=213419 RepID=A0A7H1RWW6_9BACL|nr:MULTISPECIES: GNAT family N-acetyltransferase [Geobacillus]RXS89754.1 GNAT family N-acetyltransferase [Geobacillus sp. PK12]AMQ20392.1 acetyltransferase [Geobacillus sp. JS12]QNU18755.1 GNAT family N-acetyltransferase [Geobacillus zalihae]QNU24894.1 GNAT family N-acetyltransferase [Geobacillus zalihae]WKA48769.1 GNAT family N-acetyltransferase [Geobacillus zalihae]